MQLVLTTGFYSIAPVTSLFVLASSVCWSLQCLISTLTQGAVVDTFLGSLVQLHSGEGGMLQTNNTGMCSQCLSHMGLSPLTARAPSLPTQLRL